MGIRYLPPPPSPYVSSYNQKYLTVHVTRKLLNIPILYSIYKFFVLTFQIENLIIPVHIVAMNCKSPSALHLLREAIKSNRGR